MYFNRKLHDCTAVSLAMFPSQQYVRKPADDDRSFRLQELEKDDQTHMVKSTPFQWNNFEKGSPFVSDGILKDFANKSRKMEGQKILLPSINAKAHQANDQRLSTNARIRLAGLWFIETHPSKKDEISEHIQLSVSLLSDDEAKDIRLLLNLLASAEKTGQGKFDHATKLIESCNYMSSAEGNPIERLVYHFSEAIREKINREIGRVAHDGLEKIQMNDIQETLRNIEASTISFHQRLPLSRICQFSAVHTIIQNVKKARKIHVIDLQIRTGMIYIVMLQALASHCKSHLEHVRITVIVTSAEFGKSCNITSAESKAKDIGKRLADFAQSVNIPFSFKIVMVADMLDLNIDLLELHDDEKVVVYSPVFLSKLLVKPKHLEYLMYVLRKINPCITVISEIEANHTSPAFADRFIEALFLFGALFDSMSHYFPNDDLSRRITESVFLGQTIRNIVAAEGDERSIRHIVVDVWRSYFARFGMTEIELSSESLFEEKSLIGNIDCESCCSIRVHGRCLLVNWKDIPIFSVSAWKFV